MLFQRFPYTDQHELNLDWILQQIRDLNIQGDVPSYTQHARIFNVQDFGAYGDGANDDTQAIQDAMDAAVNGGVVYFPAADYLVSQTLQIPTGVTVAGSNMYTTKIIFSGTNDVLFELTHELLSGMEIRDLALQSATEHDNVAIQGGSTVAEYNSGILSLSRLLILDFATGIYGGAVTGGVGIFDSVFRDIWFENCNAGFWCCGSGNLYEHCRFNRCSDGIVLDKLSAESMDGGWMHGCLFIANDTDIYINNDIRPFYLEGCWFEQSTNGILTVNTAGTICPVMAFKDCMLSTHSTGAECVNFYNMGTGLQIVRNCQFLQEDPSYQYGYTESNYGGTGSFFENNYTASDGTVIIE